MQAGTCEVIFAPAVRAIALSVALWALATPALAQSCNGVTAVVGAPTTAEHKCLPGDSFRDIADGPEIVVVPAGKFMMGTTKGAPNERPPHIVAIPKAFGVGKFEVTRGQFRRFVDATGYAASEDCILLDGQADSFMTKGRSWSNTGFPQNDNHPVVCLSFDDTRAYAAWLSQLTGQTYRLLSEAEWEYAARAQTIPGDPSDFGFGTYDPDTCKRANIADRTPRPQGGGWPDAIPVADCTDGAFYTAPVGSFPPNAFGLYDMVGNAWEWVEDCLAKSYDDGPTTTAPHVGGACPLHVRRGGSYNMPPMFASPTIRAGGSTAQDAGVNGSDGFRLARMLTP